jgi:hypothetical protein
MYSRVPYRNVLYCTEVKCFLEWQESFRSAGLGITKAVPDQIDKVTAGKEGSSIIECTALTEMEI